MQTGVLAYFGQTWRRCCVVSSARAYANGVKLLVRQAEYARADSLPRGHRLHASYQVVVGLSEQIAARDIAHKGAGRR